MKKNKLVLLAMVGLALIVASCSEEYPERTASYVPASDVTGAFFPASNPSIVEVLPTDSFYTITVTRLDTTKAATVKFHETSDVSNMFSIPENITFEAGQKEAELKIAFLDLVDFQNYEYGIEMDESTTNPYDTLMTGSTRYVMNITQTDYVDYAIGTFSSPLMWEGSWEQLLQYSTILDCYRLPDLFATGSHILFSWGGPDSTVVMPLGTVYSASWNTQETGYKDPDYGMITAYISKLPANTNYTPATKTFKFYIQYVVAAGSFGKYYENFVVSSFY